jgi:hypothetical protein
MKYIKLFEDYSFDVGQEINTVKYGNPTEEDYVLAYNDKCPIKDWFISKGYAKKIIDEAPKNDSEITKTDLQVLLNKTKNASGDNMNFARYVEAVDNIAQSYVDLLGQKGIDLSMGEFFGIDSQVEPLIFWLKDQINRPRPYQLARSYDLPLRPLMRTDAMSASYPSGHAATAYLMSEYLGRKYPEHKAELDDLGNRIAESRIITAIHYPSDSKISRMIVDIIFDNNLLV